MPYFCFKAGDRQCLKEYFDTHSCSFLIITHHTNILKNLTPNYQLFYENVHEYSLNRENILISEVKTSIQHI